MIDNKVIFHYLNPDACWHEATRNGRERCDSYIERGEDDEQRNY